MKSKFVLLVSLAVVLFVRDVQGYDKIGQPQKNEISIKSVPYVKNQKVAKYIYADRFLNDLNSRDLHKILGKYKPNDEKTTYFNLPCFEVPKDKVDIYLDGSNPQLANKFFSASTALMFVHPLNLENKAFPHSQALEGTLKEYLQVVPTSTSRTLVSISPENENYFIKVHLPFQLDGTVTKNFYNSRIMHEIQVSKELGLTKLSPIFAYLREPVGIAWKNNGEENHGWGYLIREMEASPPLAKETSFVPIYSLFALDSLDSAEMPLLTKLIANSNKDPKNYVLENIMYPVFDCFVEGIKKMGFVFLSHGQNVLLEFDAHYHPTGRIIHRDLGVDVDYKVRKKLGLGLDRLDPSHIFNQPHQAETPGQRYSLAYDNALGRHLFDKLSAFLHKYYMVPEEEVQRDFLKYFEKKFPDFEEYFITNNVYRSTDGIRVVSDKPVWRPLIKK